MLLGDGKKDGLGLVLGIQEHTQLGVGVGPIPWTRAHLARSPNKDPVPPTRPPTPPEFRAEAVRLVRTSGKTQKGSAADCGVSAESVRKWIREAEIDTGDSEGLTTAEQAGLVRVYQRPEADAGALGGAPQGKHCAQWCGRRHAYEVSSTEAILADILHGPLSVRDLVVFLDGRQLNDHQARRP